MRTPSIVLTFVLLTASTVSIAAAQDVSDRVSPADERRSLVQPQPGTKEHILQQLLYRTMSVQFDETPARDVFDFVQTTLGINMIVRYRDDTTGFGIDPDQPITLDFEDAPALTVLELILEQAGTIDACTWQLRRGFLEVGTKERLGVPAAVERRTYSIQDLLIEPPYFDGAPDISLRGSYEEAYNWGGWRAGYPGYGTGGYGGSFGPGGGGGSIGSSGRGLAERRAREQAIAEEIIMLITDTIDPHAWNRNGGNAATVRHQRGRLVIGAPDYIHREIDGYPFVPPPPEAEEGD